MEIKFWGVRGSTPLSGPDVAEFGGHTSCISVHTQEHVYILDAGTGLKPLGDWLLKHSKTAATLLISHVHFDHIIGLPFFNPVWTKGFALDMHAGVFKGDNGFKDFIYSYICPPLFPVNLIEESVANLTFHDFEPGHATDTKLNITTLPLNHPGGSCGFRLDDGRKVVCYISDIEHPVNDHDAAVFEFVRGADCLIYDAMYTPDQHAQKIGWGHSTWEEAAYIAKAADVKRLYLHHHNPDHSDADMRHIESLLQEKFPSGRCARQGESVNLLLA